MSQETRKKKKKDGTGDSSVSRRDFLAAAGVGAAGLAAGRAVSSSPPSPVAAGVVAAGEMTAATLRINGREHRLLVEPRWSLAYVLRERLGMTGTKLGCERGECGSCTVLIDDLPRYACMTLALEAEGTDVTTLEGLLEGEEPGPVQRAFMEQDAYQCGYCTPGQIVSVEGLLRARVAPSLDEIRLGVSGNLCRCGAYPNIFKAAQRAAAFRRGRGGRS